jgi:hypothetical protein
VQRFYDRAGFFEQLAHTTIEWMLTRFEEAARQVPKPKTWLNAAADKHQAVSVIENQSTCRWPRIVPKDPSAGRTLFTQKR